jgi:hypothetical protein
MVSENHHRNVEERFKIEKLSMEGVSWTLSKLGDKQCCFLNSAEDFPGKMV